MAKIPDKLIHRLILYRKILSEYAANEESNIYSYKLAALASKTAAQVRRDIMTVGYSGSPAHGYNIKLLLTSLDKFLDPEERQNLCVVGIGNLGRALIDHIAGRKSKMNIIAAFDNDPAKTNKIIHGVKAYNSEELEIVIQKEKIEVAILTVTPSQAQKTADKLVHSGIKAIINFTPTNLNLPGNIIVENIDLLLTVEKTAFFARLINKD